MQLKRLVYANPEAEFLIDFHIKTENLYMEIIEEPCFRVCIQFMWKGKSKNIFIKVITFLVASSNIKNIDFIK